VFKGATSKGRKEKEGRWEEGKDGKGKPRGREEDGGREGRGRGRASPPEIFWPRTAPVFTAFSVLVASLLIWSITESSEPNQRTN